MRDISNSESRWLNSLWIVSMISKKDTFKFKLSLSLWILMCFVMNNVLSESRWNWLFSLVQRAWCSFACLEGGITVTCLCHTPSTQYALAAFYADFWSVLQWHAEAFLRKTQNSLTFFDQLLIRIHYPTGFGLTITRSSVWLQASLTPVQCSLWDA